MTGVGIGAWIDADGVDPEDDVEAPDNGLGPMAICWCAWCGGAAMALGAKEGSAIPLALAGR